jgi:hypothetical protein
LPSSRQQNLQGSRIAAFNRRQIHENSGTLLHGFAQRTADRQRRIDIEITGKPEFTADEVRF